MAISRAAVHHRPKSNYAYAYDESTVHIRLRTERGDLEDVTLLYGDKYDWPDSAKRVSMERLGHDETFDYWQATATPPYRRLCYAFELEAPDESLWFTEWGFEPVTGSVPEREENGTLHFFEYPFLNSADINDPPEWANDAVFYQIFPERFANGNPDLDPEGVEEWGEQPKRDNFFGGDLQGIIDNLEYIDDLGVTALYLTPVFESTSNHKYNTTDYRTIDPHFGDQETLKTLVDAAHERDIRVMLDAVFNHCGRQFEPFQDVLEHGEDSEYADWFHIREFPIEFEPKPSYDAFAFEPYMPKLNTENPEVKSYLLEVATHWIEVADIDGWRLDVANEVDHQFWREMRQAVTAIKPEAYILGEIWHDSSAWLRGDQFDSVMNYPFSYTAYDFLATDEIDASTFAEKNTRFQVRYPEQVNEVLFNLLSSHDTPRMLHRCDGDEQRLRLAFFLQLTSPGTPCIYYGDEIGMTGGQDPDCRRTMIWDETKQNRDLRAFVSQLVQLRHDHRALRRGRVRFVQEACTEALLVYQRFLDDDADTYTVALNRGSDPVHLSVLEEGAELLCAAGTESEFEEGEWTVPATSAAVWRHGG
ncbi:alpha amylase N-terminal ig-like domain-containing protein [Natrialbaceae archaeon A-CW2]|uniref:glycoside hydrolase family 13 protein n=1 Tax=Natronosalvus amylolyticus TaxID=2961994 RepID=UPI0020C969BF|nr:glycoside hydrolase family 13 protein [Natronosalvus amylolyticus]